MHVMMSETVGIEIHEIESATFHIFVLWTDQLVIQILNLDLLILNDKKFISIYDKNKEQVSFQAIVVVNLLLVLTNGNKHWL